MLKLKKHIYIQRKAKKMKLYDYQVIAVYLAKC